MSQVIPTWLGSFFGSDLGFLNYEILSIAHIPRKELTGEAELMKTKWFDYRRLHPMQATYYFMQCYKVAYQTFMRSVVDVGKGNMLPIKGMDFLNAREKLSFWRLRQFCDRNGVRYDFFLGKAMKWYAEECFRRSALYAPRPAQIASNEDLIVDAMLAWEEMPQISLQIARDPWYRASNFIGHPDQLAYEASIVAQIKLRQHQRFALNAALYVHDAMRIETALANFAQRDVEDAIRQVDVPDVISHR